MPAVSVLTPIYNTNHAHLRQCIESILNQTFTDFEFIILNDSPNNAELEKLVRSYDDMITQQETQKQQEKSNKSVTCAIEVLGIEENALE
ncbi:MAG: glycosyltransferase, partial [Alphaproteobacteria bacterium]|nr:glycosyltransferase [Alphaproteobacteria bacterium]